MDFGGRNYDSRIVKWLTVDPLVDEFPWQSPYVAMDNSPILKNDPTGKSGEVTINRQAKTITIRSTYFVENKEFFDQAKKNNPQQWSDPERKIMGLIKQLVFPVSFSF